MAQKTKTTSKKPLLNATWPVEQVADAVPPQPAVESPTPIDPWAHRPAGMRCTSCMAFVAKSAEGVDVRGRLGRCRANSPTFHGWPVVFETDWCLGHRLDESKL